VADREISEQIVVSFAVRRISDPSLEQGIERVVRPGEPGEIARTVVARFVDGVEAERKIISESEIAAPVAEVRAIGTRPRQAPVAPAEIASIVRAAADRWGADPDTLLRVAWCESRYNPSAYNHASGATGLFQFMPATFARNSARAGFGDASIWDPVASANTAAYMFAIGQARQWACK
jgi:soluble lytic murein transglycosylase-like protein